MATLVQEDTSTGSYKMARKLSFSVENILNGCTVSSTGKCITIQQYRDRSLSDCSTLSSGSTSLVERLATPPSSPLSTCNPSPLAEILTGEECVFKR